MSKNLLATICTDVSRVLVKRSPEILTGLGITGMITAIVLAVKATPKALQLIANEKERRIEEDLEDSFTSMDVVKTSWKCYIPTTIVALTSVACLIGGSSENLRRNAALATAYSLSESALKEYQGKVIETFGEKGNAEVKEALAKEKGTQKNNVINNKEVLVVGKGETLCEDALFGRTFKADVDTIKSAVVELNRQLALHTSASLNDLYYEIGISNIGKGDEYGWNIDDGTVKPYFSSKIAADGSLCLLISYLPEPKINYAL